jgi:F-type H+-transporting ATPase subunit b
VLEFNLGLAVYTLVLFGLSLFVLSRTLFGPIQRVIDQRQKHISDQIAEAERAKEEAATLAAEYRNQRQQARAQAEEIVERARRTGEQTREEILAKAQEERQRQEQQTRDAVDAEIRQARERLREDAAGLVVTATERVTRRRLTGDDQLRMVQEAIDELDFDELAGAAAGNGADGSRG